MCTDDSCDSILGCQNVDNSARCDDADECTEDVCDSILGCSNPPTGDPDCDVHFTCYDLGDDDDDDDDALTHPKSN